MNNNELFCLRKQGTIADETTLLTP